MKQPMDDGRGIKIAIGVGIAAVILLVIGAFYV